jgi:hypothetical protein
MKAQRGKALKAVLGFEKKLSELEKKEERTVFQKFSLSHILEKKRIGAERQQAERWASDAKANIEDDELRLSTGKNKEGFDQTQSQLVAQRSATEARRATILKEHGEVSRELSHASKIRMELKKLGHSKVRAICERGKVPEVNKQEIRQKIREIERTQERSLGYDRGR